LPSAKKVKQDEVFAAQIRNDTVVEVKVIGDNHASEQRVVPCLRIRGYQSVLSMLNSVLGEILNTRIRYFQWW
jgi:hypothetical protein